jgi:pimeloyl-ACP methyl ester carboxylesterase
MKERFFVERGLYYRVNEFRAERQTLVFVHGVSGSSSAWRPYEMYFAGQYNVITFDLRGHGRSKRYPCFQDYAVEQFVEDLLALLDRLAIRACVLVCHSFATLIALEFVRRHRSRVAAAVLISADFDVGRTRRARLLGAALGPIAWLDRMPFHPPGGGHVDYTRFPQTGDWNLPRMLADIRNTTWRVYLYCTRQIYAVHAGPLLKTIRFPVLLIHGRSDTIFPLDGALHMAREIESAQLVVLEAADHILVLNHPDTINAAIGRFLQSLAARHPTRALPREADAAGKR